MIPLFVETDIHDDVDDVGALAVAHVLELAGRIRLQGINVNTASVWGPRLVRAINRYYGSDVPVGAQIPASGSTGPEEFVRGTSRLFGTDDAQPDDEAIALFRRVLAGAPEGGITVVSLGFFGNLTGLLASGPDEVSPLTGAELVRRAVARTVVMGGCFGGGPADAAALPEYNFAEDPERTRVFLRDWPGPIDFVGWETGYDVVTGRGLLAAHGRESPVSTAYQLHSGFGNGRPSWDLIAVLLAADPGWEAFEWSGCGEAGIDGLAVTSWVPGVHGRHRHAIRRAAPEEVAAELDALLLRRAGAPLPV